MIFDKVDEYLIKIFDRESAENDFNLFFSNNGVNTIGGLIKKDNEAYILSKKKNKIGLKINNGKYIFLQNRIKFSETEEFLDIIENDAFFSEDEATEEFKDVEYVSFWEKDQEKGTIIKLCYLANKSSYLLLDYYKIFDDYSNIASTIKDDIFTIRGLINFDLTKPKFPNFNIMDKNKIILVPDNYHAYYTIKDNDKEITHEEPRKVITKKAYNEIIEADRKSYMVRDDANDCLDIVKKSLQDKFSKNNLEER